MEPIAKTSTVSLLARIDEAKGSYGEVWLAYLEEPGE